MNIYYCVLIENYDIFLFTMYGDNKIKISSGEHFVTIQSKNICHTCNIVNEICKAFNIPYIRNLNKRVMIWEMKKEIRGENNG